MTKQEINLILTNLMREGLTQGEAYVRLRRIMVIRLEHCKRGTDAEMSFLRDLELLDSICILR